VWDNYGGGADASKYVAYTGITKDNVGRLQVAWSYETGDEISYPFNPVIVDGVMYVLAKNNSLVALDAATGKEIWIHARLGNLPRRGINFWQSPDGSDRRILIQVNNYLQAIDARTGQSILGFGNNGLVDLKVGLTPRDPATVGGAQSYTPGVVFENLIVLGTAPGENYLGAPGQIRAYDVVTGEHVWTFHTVPQPGEYGYDTWPPEAYRYIGGANVWGEFAVDTRRGIVYAPTGSPSYDFYGADRIGANLFANSLLALDARTGKRLWHFQVVHHDLRDFDLAAAPQLVTINHNGHSVDAVAIATKQGMLFAFDRVTGEPLWPIEERPIPRSDVPGEQSWPTAPFQPQLPPFGRQSMTSADVNPFLPAGERAAMMARVDSLVARGRVGLYVPLSHEEMTLAMPGTLGGANYGHTAADPRRGMVFVISNDGPSFYEPMERRTSSDPPPPAGRGGPGGGPAGPPGRGGMAEAAALVAQGEALYQQQCQACHLANRRGRGAAPSLLGVENRLSGADFLALLRSGRGEMPAFGHLSDENVQALYRYLGGAADGGVVPLPDGPVVASGGAPGGLLPRPVAGGGGFGRQDFGIPYPERADAPDVRYFIRGYGMQYSAIGPPWSSITAYDLNSGTLQWTRPLGTDRMAAEQGVSNTGVPETMHNGMVVTATGLVFSNARDGTLYAFDVDTGEELWAMQLPGNSGSEGIPAMYEVNGKQYLVVAATSPHRGLREPAEQGEARRHYVAFALPD
jgi:quinoprotein glucose dehydrogenase